MDDIMSKRIFVKKETASKPRSTWIGTWNTKLGLEFQSPIELKYVKSCVEAK